MKRILLVDDSEKARQALRLLLKTEGYACDEVEHGAAALVWLEEGHGIDLVISDNQMPIMTGLELLKEIVNHPTLHLLPFILYSGNVTEVLRDRALQAGAFAVLSKPPDFSEFASAINRAFAKH